MGALKSTKIDPEGTKNASKSGPGSLPEKGSQKSRFFVVLGGAWDLEN